MKATFPDPEPDSPPARQLAGQTLDEVAGFVRGTLGCGCPDDVLRSIRMDRPGSGELPTVRLQVGSRLLICLVGAPRSHTQADRVQALVVQGRAERDAGGYNRFRLVLVTNGTPDATVIATAEAGFLAGAAGDEQSYLHRVARQDVPGVIRPD